MSDELDPLMRDVISTEEAPPLSDQQEHGFRIMADAMIQQYAKTLGHVNPLVRGAKLEAYSRGVRDALNVMRRVLERPTEEELLPG